MEGDNKLMENLEKSAARASKLQKLAQANPTRYKIQLTLLSAFGYAFILATLLIGLACSVGLIAAIIFTKNVWVLKFAGKLAFVPLVLSFVIFKALLTRIQAPEGERVTAKTAPQLFNAIRDVEKKVGSKKVDRVLLTNDFNAAVVSVPRLGVLGWHRRYLLLGVPLLASLSEHEFRSVLAHECGHLLNNHARFGNWIYRQRQSWMRLMVSLERQRSALTSWFAAFFNWYAPYFNAYSFALAQANEYEADRAAAEAEGSAVTASALTKVYVFSHWLNQRYWPSLFATAAHVEHPPAGALSNSIAELKHIEPEQLVELHDQTLAETTGTEDTHPSLKDRVTALGASSTPPSVAEQSALEVLLPQQGQELLSNYDEAWAESVAPEWQAHHQQMKELVQTRQRLIDKQQQAALSVDELLELASATEALDQPAAAVAVYEEVLAEDSNNAMALFSCGRLRLTEGDESGVEMIQQAATLDKDAQVAAAQLLYGYHMSRGEHAEAQAHLDALQSHAASQQALQQKWAKISKKDHFETHGLGSPEVTAFAKDLSSVKHLKKAWLARKVIADHPDALVFVLMIRLGGFIVDEDVVLNDIVDRAGQHLGFVVVLKVNDNRPILRKIIDLEGAQVV